MQLLAKFGSQLRNIREKRQMTQEDLAFKSGISVYYISKLERGKANPSLETMNKVSKALSVSLSELLKGI